MYGKPTATTKEITQENTVKQLWKELICDIRNYLVDAKKGNKKTRRTKRQKLRT